MARLRRSSLTALARLVAIDADQHATFLPTIDLESETGAWELIAPHAPDDRFEGTNIEELIDAGHLEWVNKLPNKIIGSFKLTTSGRELARDESWEQRFGVAPAPVDVSWARIRPVLEGVIAEWPTASRGDYVPIARVAARLDRNETTVFRQAQLLASGGYLELEPSEDDDAPEVIPTDAGVAAIGRWPSGEAQLEHVLAALTAVHDQTTDPEKRSKLKRAREGLEGLGLESYGAIASAIASGAIG